MLSNQCPGKKKIMYIVTKISEINWLYFYVKWIPFFKDMFLLCKVGICTWIGFSKLVKDELTLLLLMTSLDVKDSSGVFVGSITISLGFGEGNIGF